ncbi:MAG: type VI secretion system protein TssA [Desulfobacteraceae bacterium]|nr:MAG: type VI secretion system protein TssA [Desulfobacteraceae bacterium]
MLDTAVLLRPLEGDNPAGENLRYSQVYDEIEQARKEEDTLDRGDWGREIKTADWDKVKRLAIAALTEKTKDLQIAVWLCEALIRTDGFAGLCQGFGIISGLLEKFWDHMYPEIEDGDLDYRAGPLEFMNEKMWLPIKQVPLTDPAAGPGYSLINYQESLQVGSETDVGNDEKTAARQALMAEGKPSVEQFDAAVAKSSKRFYQDLNGGMQACLEAFARLDQLLDERFGNQAPRTADLKEALEACAHYTSKTLKLKLDAEPDPVAPAGEPQEGQASAPYAAFPETIGPHTPAGPGPAVVSASIVDTQSHEMALWNAALAELNGGSLKKALDILFTASVTSASHRAKTRFRLMMAQLCVSAGRVDLARPIAEELNTMVEELGLGRWESPVWIADVLGALYKCLSRGNTADEDASRAEEILKKITTIDVTKAMQYKS